MKLYRWFRRLNRRSAYRENYQRGYDAGKAEVDAAWDAWNQRRVAATARGESFQEPHPDFSGSEASPLHPTAGHGRRLRTELVAGLIEHQDRQGKRKTYFVIGLARRPY